MMENIYKHILWIGCVFVQIYWWMKFLLVMYSYNCWKCGEFEIKMNKGHLVIFNVTLTFGVKEWYDICET